MTNITVCRYCAERKLGCHDHCKKYQDEKHKNDMLKHKIQAEKAQIRFQIDQVVRCNDRRLRKRR